MKSALEKLGCYQRSLGRFFTPQPVVDLAYDLINEIHPSKGTHKVADPACGHGEFISQAIAKGFAKKQDIYGSDIARDMQTFWQESKYLEKAELELQDGLLTDQKTENRFDWVLGNPPFGSGQILRAADFSQEDPILVDICNKYTVWNLGKKAQQQSLGPILSVDTKDLKTIKSLPVEIYFLERFLKMAKPGGTVGIILPMGIFANSKYQKIRQWLLEMATIQCIIGLPRGTFDDSGTKAKTCLLILSKKNSTFGHRPYLARIRKFETMQEEAEAISENFKEWMKTGKSDLHLPYQDSDEFTLRMDPEFWIMRPVLPRSNGIKWAPLKDFLDLDGISQGPKGPSVYVEKDKGIQYLRIDNITETGIDTSINPVYVEKDGPMTSETAFPHKDYILLVRTGATIGKVAYLDYEPDFFVSSVIYKLRVKNISPAYVAACLKSSFGQNALLRFKNGVGVENLNLVNEVPLIEIPVLDDEYQKMVELEMKAVARLNEAAIQLKSQYIESGLSEKEAEDHPEVYHCAATTELRLGKLLTDLEKAVYKGIET